jgi:hypothetical protein
MRAPVSLSVHRREARGKEAKGTNCIKNPSHFILAHDPDLVPDFAKLVELGEGVGRLVESSGEAAEED